jgi:fatty acid desaturase
MDATPFVGTTPLYPRSKYVAELRSALPPEVNEPARSRAALVPIYLAVIATAITAVALGWIPWPVVPIVSVVIGVCFGALTFVAHEALHGGIVRDKRLQHIIGFFGFLPFTISPRLWVAWHNISHHGNTQLPDDPDGYATLERYRERRSTRFSVDSFSLGGRRWRGILSLVLGFTVQSADQLASARSRGFLAPRQFRLALAETALGVAVWATVAVLVGPLAFLFVYVLPLLIGNACVMAFILTNHSLSPRTSINDPLINSLSVTTPGFIERITLRFGLHVEHHLFPAMSSRHAPAVRDLVRARWPERYQSMPLTAALRALHRTARVYKDETTLVDPLTGAEHPTLLPKVNASAQSSHRKASNEVSHARLSQMPSCEPSMIRQCSLT